MWSWPGFVDTQGWCRRGSPCQVSEGSEHHTPPEFRRQMVSLPQCGDL